MGKLRDQIRRSMLGTSLGTLLFYGLLIVCFLFLLFNQRYKNELRSQLLYVSTACESAMDTEEFWDRLPENIDTRFSLVDENGIVVLDTFVEAVGEDVSARPEVRQALEMGAGYDLRKGHSFQDVYYYATRLSDGRVLRLSRDFDTAQGMIPGLVIFLLLTSIVLLPFLSVMSERLAGAIIHPIVSLRLDDFEQNEESYVELMPLMERLKVLQRQNRRQVLELTARQREFTAITAAMSEGLILFSERGEILAINHSAEKILSTGNGVMTGHMIHELAQSETLCSAVSRAKGSGTFWETLQLNERYYQLITSPVATSDIHSGVVLLIHDITQQHEAEQQRRDFSANVSHELKTPLTSILGFAEIMQSGLVDDDAMRDFSGRIHNEAARLLSLIDDIIHLSRLDEEAGLPEPEKVDMRLLADSIVKRLAQRAETSGITLRVEGDDVELIGIRPVLNEMLYNLVDNAIKYNTENGRVTISLHQTGQSVSVAVADTGIGIASEHQERVFDRFYRVDKSHSRAIGGTGLGLSIVKHGALLHHAEIRMDSRPGHGTRITITFPTDAFPDFES